MNYILPRRYKAFLYCFMLCFSGNFLAQGQCTFDIKDYEPIPEKDCLYLLQLEDTSSNGWDGASIDVSVGETWPANNYKVTVADGQCKFIPIYVNDGETIDLAYWNGAFENEHNLSLYNAYGELVNDINGNPVMYTGDIPANTPIRVKADCPVNACEETTEQFIVRITMGFFPEEQSWEIYQGEASTSDQGAQVFGVNANTYNGLAPGFQIDHVVSLDLCEIHTFVAFDGFNDGWDSGAFELISYSLNYGTEITDPLDTHFGKSLVFNGTGILDETRLEFTLPCASNCTPVYITDAENCEVEDPELPLNAPEICYPACNHAEGCDIMVQQTILPYGVNYDAIAGAAAPYTGSGSVVFPATLPAGQHSLVTAYTYCDGVIVKCTTDLVITGESNATLACNDNVIIPLGVPSSSLGIHTLNECIVAVTPDMVLEMPNICESEYAVTIYDASGVPLEVYGPTGLPLDAGGNEIPEHANTPPAHNFISTTELMQTLTYTVKHLGSENLCWGTLTVEDKVAPVIDCVDYDLHCTHPYAMDEDYTHTEVYEVASELPANIAGGDNVLASNTYIPVNMPCGALGEFIQDIEVKLALTHDNLSDLSVILHAPAAFGLGTITLANNGAVSTDNTWTFTNAPSLISFLNSSCAMQTSTNPEYHITENSGVQAPSNLGNTWYIQVIDNNADFIIAPYGGGEVTAASISLTCGFPTPSAAFDCSLESIEMIAETIEETACNQADGNGARIARTWEATDKFNNVRVCTQYVNLKAPTLDEIVKPDDVSIPCNGQTAADLTLEDTGYPTFGCFGLTPNLHNLCDVSYSYEDLAVPTCGTGFKMIRTWTFVNWCSGVSKTHEQIIKVEDNEGPSINQEDITVNTNVYSCNADLGLTDFDITDNCSGISSITARYISSGANYQNAGEVIIDLTNGGTLEGLPVGENAVTIIAKDNCYNQTDTTITITVIDNTPPVAICDDQLHVSLGGDGTAILRAEDVDEGSYDNCSEVLLEVRRIDGCLGATAWANTVPFACCDVDELITVELRVSDDSGNSNICWKSVLVEDALAPILTCPADKTITCEDSRDNIFGEATAVDNCEVTVTHEDGGELDQCQAGILTRTFTANDNSQKSGDATCIQRITVEHVSDFIVQFPADVESNSCELVEAGEPIISDDDCELIAISSEDRIFDIVPDACYKIERTWTIVNWCVYEAGNPDNTHLGIPQPLPRTYQDDDGYFQYVQTIKVFDDEAPTMDNPGDLEFCDTTDGCEGEATLSVFPTDNCSDFFDLVYTYRIDLHNDGTIDIVEQSDNADGVYPYGTHRIMWAVNDGCGNVAEVEHLFTIKDCKNPTPVCLNGISIPGMNPNGCVEIWASDLLEYGFDNCSSDEYIEASARIRLEGSTDAPSTGITLCCEDIGTTIVEIWVEDEAGNTDYCTTYIILQDNNDNCDDDDDGAASSVAGLIQTTSGDAVEEVNVELEGAQTLAMTTDVSGEYVFANLPNNNAYSVAASKDINPTNGVTTYDLVLMSQHILGVNTIESPYTMIAADVNNDGVISTFDVVQTRQLILYVVSDFPSNTSWRFVDAAYAFPNPNNPWKETFPEAIDLETLTEDALGNDFVAIKIGDIDGSATPNSLLGAEERTASQTLQFNVDAGTYTKGEQIRIDFRANDFTDINGFQFTMNFDRTGMTFVSMKSDNLEMTESNLGLSMTEEGIITASWNAHTPVTAQDDAILFSLFFAATSDVSLQEAVNINSRYTHAEAYQIDELMDVTLAFETTEGLVSQNEAFELHQNTPNPFSASTTISFSLPTASTATLNIMDVSGRTLKTVSGDFAKGYNQISLDKADLPATGILYYELRTPTHTASKKMIVLE